MFVEVHHTCIASFLYQCHDFITFPEVRVPLGLITQFTDGTRNYRNKKMLRTELHLTIAHTFYSYYSWISCWWCRSSSYLVEVYPIYSCCNDLSNNHHTQHYVVPTINTLIRTSPFCTVGIGVVAINMEQFPLLKPTYSISLSSSPSATS